MVGDPYYLEGIPIIWNILSNLGVCSIKGRIEKIPYKNTRNIHLNRIKQRFLLNLLRELDYDFNT
jgi:hypothetical protein